MKINWRFLLK